MQEAKYLAADAERKYEEVARKLNMLETDLLKAMLRSRHKISTKQKLKPVYRRQITRKQMLRGSTKG
jgi:hypothetical protein